MQRNRVTVLVNDAEHAELSEKAKEVGMSVSAYIRWKLFYCKEKEE